MAIIDDRTPRLNLQIPVRTNALKDDVERLRATFTTLDEKVATVGDDGKLDANQLPEISSSTVVADQELSGSLQRTQRDKNAEYLTMFDFSNITGDGVANDTAGLSVIEALASAPVIYGLGKTFKVDATPTAKRYCDGWWLVNGDLIPFDYSSVVTANRKVIALGPNAAMSASGARNCIAIGEDALRSNTKGRHNIAIGISALHYLDGPSTSGFDGTRNIGIGGNTGRFMTTGNRNIIMGRDAGHNLTSAALNIIIGNAAAMGDGPNTLDPGVIVNQTPMTTTGTVLIGVESGKYYNSGYGVGIGYQALKEAKTDTGIVGVGSMAFAAHQSDLSFWGTTQSIVSLSGAYDQSASKAITCTVASHGMATGFKAWIRFTTGANADVSYQDDIWFDVTVVDADTFTIQSPVVSTASGAILITKIATNTTYTTLTGGCVGIGREVGNGVSNYRSTGMGDRAGAKGLGVENVAIGYQVHYTNTPGSGNTAVGAYSQNKITSVAVGNVSVGVLTLNSLTSGLNNTAIGSQSMRYATSGSNNVGCGGNTLRGLTTGNYNTAVGPDALRYNLSGTDHNYNNCAGIGYQSYVSGDNQNQIGNSSTTTYVYGTVQNRSDERDKADVRDTQLGIDFIMGLRPVDGKWDMREDYLEPYKVQVGIDDDAKPVFETRFNQLERDGSKKRDRYHHWFIAQEVAALCKKLGVEFGGFQDHSIKGGEDVLSLGYDEFIPPIVRSVQQCWERMDELEARLAALEAK